MKKNLNKTILLSITLLMLSFMTLKAQSLNPTSSIVTFKYGTASVVDMSGRILQEFAINSRTVPVNLRRYSEGIYIINIKTDVKTESVKVIKSVN